MRRPPRVAADVVETCLSGWDGFVLVEDPYKPHSHLPALQRLSRTEPGLVYTAGTVEDPLIAGPQSINSGLVHPGVLSRTRTGPNHRTKRRKHRR